MEIFGYYYATIRLPVHLYLLFWCEWWIVDSTRLMTALRKNISSFSSSQRIVLHPSSTDPHGVHTFLQYFYFYILFFKAVKENTKRYSMHSSKYSNQRCKSLKRPKHNELWGDAAFLLQTVYCVNASDNIFDFEMLW